jgi:hypothetical protein
VAVIAAVAPPAAAMVLTAAFLARGAGAVRFPPAGATAFFGFFSGTADFVFPDAARFRTDGVCFVAGSKDWDSNLGFRSERFLLSLITNR